MSNHTGRGNRPRELAPRASVRHLHADDAEGSGATSTDAWYETERLAGQITGGGRTAAPAVPQSGAPVVLAWRHAELATAPSVLQRLARSLAERGHRVVSKTQARRPWLMMLTTRRAVAPPTVEPQLDKPTADEVLAAEPGGRADPLGSADAAPDHLEWRSPPAPKARRERAPRPSRRGLTGIALVLSAAVVSIIAITSHTNGRAVSSHQASFATATSRPRVALIAAAKTVLGVLGTVEHQARTAPARQRIMARRALPRRRPDHNVRHSRPAGPQGSSLAAQAPAISPAPQAPAAPQASAASPTTSSSSDSGGSANVTGASSSQTSAAPPTSSSQSASPAPAASQSQPPGPTGPAAILGPGQCGC
jgi:hypothetical protein